MDFLRELKNTIKLSRNMQIIIVASIIVITLLWYFRILWVVVLGLLAILVLIGLTLTAIFSYNKFIANTGKLKSLKLELARRVNHLKSLDLVKSFWHKKSTNKLPCYLLIGPCASGKTTLLKQSGDIFSTLKTTTSESVDEIGDWWYANQGVIINASNNHLDNTQEPSTWTLLIKKIKKIKSSHPLKGIILTLPHDDLITEPTALLETFRTRIDTIYHQLGAIVPVYLIITMCDKIPGFSSYFENIDANNLKKPCGIAFTNNNKQLLQLSLGINSIFERLTIRSLSQLHLSKSSSNKIDHIRFPQNFINLKDKLERVISIMTRDSIYQEPVSFAGIYFTATTKNDAYFLHELFNHHLFNNNQQIQLSKRKNKQLAQWQRIKVCALTIVFITTFWMLTNAYQLNLKFLQKGNKLISNIAHENYIQQSERFAYIEAIGQHLNEIINYKQYYPWYKRLGMASNKSQQESFENIFTRYMDKEFYKPMKHLLAETLVSMHNKWQNHDDKARAKMRGNYYLTLKAYLMMSFPQQMDLDIASNTVAKYWLNMRNQDNNNEIINITPLVKLSRVYLEHLTKFKSNKLDNITSYEFQSIKNARQDLKTPSGISNLYAEMETHLNSKLGYTSIENLLEDDNSDLWQSNFQMPKIFTKETYEKIIQPILVERSKTNPRHDWVIHSPLSKLGEGRLAITNKDNNKQSSKILLGELKTQYFNRYLEKWLEFISSIKTISFGSYYDASQQLRALQQKNGPIKPLFKMLNNNFNITQHDLDILPEHIRTRFTELNLFTNNHDMLISYTNQLDILQQDIERVSQSQSPELTAEKYVLQLFNNQGSDTELHKTSLIINKLTHVINNLSSQKAMQNLLISPVQSTFKALISDVGQDIQSSWHQDLFIPYRQKIASYFPFEKNGQDLSLSDFNSFFKPQQGTYQMYMQEHIFPFIDKTNGRYTSKKWQGIGLPIAPKFMQSLYDMEHLIQALYPKGNELALQYSIYPIPTPGVKEILFSSNNQTYPYHNGPQEWVGFTWPSQDNIENETFIRVTEINNDRQLIKEFQGVWGLFHLLQSARSKYKSSNGYINEWLFNNKGRNTTIKMKIASKNDINIFESLLISPLQLPEKIIDIN